MESKEKVELLQKSIKQRLVDEQKTTSSSSHHNTESSVAAADAYDDGNSHLHIVSNLLSQDCMSGELNESMVAKEREIEPSEISKRTVHGNEVGSGNSGVSVSEEIIKELREVKKQNSRTHWLLSALIALTLAWQLSEVSLILKLKEGLKNPLKPIGGMIAGMFKGPAINGQQVEKDAAIKQKPLVQTFSLPGVKVPELPHSMFSYEE